MSLYYVQKAIYDLNRDPDAAARFSADGKAFAAAYDLTGAEQQALVTIDVGMLYVLGVNGQLLMHFAAANGFEWKAYIGAMRDGVARYGQVREGLYTMVGDPS